MHYQDRSIESFEDLFVQVRQYLKLQKEYTLVQLTAKLASLLSAIVLVIVFLILGVAALFYFLLSLAYLLEPYVGGLKYSFAIIGLIDIVIILVIAANRKKWIIRPTVNFLAHLLLDEGEEVKHE